ncbi:MAG: gamma-glutamyl-gamma-aminobutyrate hydrolase family protein [Rickettsiales bacterium]|nr:gamma-glutamyl-gamma-aminobutyrate hydrolase family protein [Rickettsiales bacterium]
MKKPIIGIVIDYSNKTTKQGGYANYPWYALRMHYCSIISGLGGVPILLPYENSAIQYYIEICNGLVFPGGDMDINPSVYGEEISVKKINLDQNNPRLKFEFGFLRAALKTKIPILGICAGFQMLNVVLGGSLFQDIDEQMQTDVAHMRRSEDIPQNTHPIMVTKGSLLHQITQKTSYIVNSFHHQAIKKLGKNLKISAVTSDEVIEAIELDNHPFCIGVEWHPEFQETDEDKKLFEAFVGAAQKYS